MNDFCNSAIKILSSKKHKGFVIGKELKSLTTAINAKMPTKNEIYTLISAGGFSSVAVIAEIAKSEVIEQLYCSTFRIGKKQFKVLQALHKKGSIKSAEFYTSNLQARADLRNNKYNYIDFINHVAQNNDWIVKPVKNHSKVILCKTANDNYYVVTTSSNLNENPQIEQFNIFNDSEMFEFYKNNLFELLKNV